MIGTKELPLKGADFSARIQANIEPFFGSCFISLHSVAQIGEPNWPPIPQEVVLGGCRFQAPPRRVWSVHVDVDAYKNWCVGAHFIDTDVSMISSMYQFVHLSMCFSCFSIFAPACFWCLANLLLFCIIFSHSHRIGDQQRNAIAQHRGNPPMPRISKRRATHRFHVDVGMCDNWI